MRAQLLALIATAALIAAMACGDDGSTASFDTVVGNYTASTFTSTSGGTTTDHLAAGGSLTIALAFDRTTTGRLFVPNAGKGGGDLDADMGGTWTLTETTVRFVQTADTFVRDMPFTAEPNRLRGEGTFAGTTVRVTLSK